MTKSDKYSSALRALFEQRPCWMIEPLAEKLCRSVPSVRRILAARGYYSSFTHNGRWYTLDWVPEFDRDGLWFCEDIGFSREGTLTATLAHLVGRSLAGMTAAELGLKLHCRCHAILTHLHRVGTLGRRKVGRSYVYLAADAAVSRRQQRALAERTLTAGPLPAEVAVLVLVEFIRSPRASAEELARSLAQNRHVAVSPIQIDRLFEQHGVKKTPPTPRRTPCTR